MLMSLFQEESVQQRIIEGIGRHRQRDVVLKIKDTSGKCLVDAPLEIRQISSDFLFGSNIFMLDGYPTEQTNKAYAEAFTQLFNAASVPFYWKGLEPEEGTLRFGADRPFVSRRPPPDVVVDFCEANGLNMNGHCLIWDHSRWSVPEWVVDSEHCTPCPLDTSKWPSHGRSNTFRTRRLMINDTTGAAWPPPVTEKGVYAQLTQDLMDDGARVDGIGLQWHQFNDVEMREFMDGKTLSPDQQFKALDAYQAFGRPLHISEITLPEPTFVDDPRGTQKELLVTLYRLWFSHPAVHAITWWNLADGGGAPGEDALSGLLDADVKPKPAYEALHDLIYRELRTQVTGRMGRFHSGDFMDAMRFCFTENGFRKSIFRMKSRKTKRKFSDGSQRDSPPKKFPKKGGIFNRILITASLSRVAELPRRYCITVGERIKEALSLADRFREMIPPH